VATWIDEALNEGARLLDWLRATDARERVIERLTGRLVTCFVQSGRVLTCGNGGSMCDAMHLAEELSGRFRRDRMALPAMALSDPAYLTCVANDWDFEHVFARGVEAWGRAGDVLVVFSTSGRSANVVAAARTARARHLTVLGLLGSDGGEVRPLCDDAIVVPSNDSGRVQEVHIRIVHLLIEGIERALMPEHYAAALDQPAPDRR
jgi:D-sedoheptulose 7-phosphate isomerase